MVATTATTVDMVADGVATADTVVAMADTAAGTAAVTAGTAADTVATAIADGSFGPGRNGFNHLGRPFARLVLFLAGQHWRSERPAVFGSGSVKSNR
jgi:hypothetical protein